MIGKLSPVARVLMFGSVEDTESDGSPGEWLSQTGATPAKSYYGFDHAHDPYWDDNNANWVALGMDRYGAVVDVDTANGAYNGARRFSTSMIPSTGVSEGRDAHGAMIRDLYTPLRSDGSPWFNFDGIWGFMMEGE